MAETAPVSVVTGFLGSGKTTLLNRLLQHPGMADTAVIVNEFGEIGLDHLLVETALEDAVLLKSGCVCCSIRGDLVDTLLLIASRREHGDFPDFSRVMVETTGLADPAPVLQTLLGEPSVGELYRLGNVVTTVDAINGAQQLDVYEEPKRQAAVADRLIVTKTDLATAAQVSELTARLRQINPMAPIFRIANGEIDPELLMGEAGGAREAPVLLEQEADAHGHGHHHHRHEHEGNEIGSFCVYRDEPIDGRVLRRWLESLISLRGADLLRIKGIVNVAGNDQPVIVQAVQHLFHPPTRLERWPDDDRRSRIVFIHRNIPQEGVEAALDALEAAEAEAA